MNETSERATAFLIVSLVVFGVWTFTADTERVLRMDARGQPVYSWANVTKMIDGSTPAPFVTRRLLPDSARALAAAIPASGWSAISNLIDGPSLFARLIRAGVKRLNWKPEYYPELVSAHVLIWLSVLGFLYTSTAFAKIYYEMPHRIGTWLSALMGFGLLGGYSSTWQGYPYDLPNAFIFLLTLYGIGSGAMWWPLAFIAASYSKETACLLILGYAIAHRNRYRSRHYWIVLGLMAVAYLLVRAWIQLHWSRPAADNFWYPARNVALLVRTALHDSWFLMLSLVLLARFRRMWSAIPKDLRLLLSIGVCLMVAGFFMGFLEERRTYFEVYPICALIIAQWSLHEWGREDLLRPRRTAAA